MNKAVIYARYSSNHQREESIEGQLRECMTYAKRNELTVIDTYIDRALTGKTDARPSFLQMISDSATKTFDYVIVYTLDRFSRNRYDSATYKAKLKKNGVKVLSAKENIADDPSGILLESLLEGMAEYYSAELAQKVKRGMKENALSCRWASGVVPFGYVVDKDKHLQLDPETAPIVKDIFVRYANGELLSTIAKDLNNKGIHTRANKKWSRSSFHRMLQAEVYIGTFVWSDVKIENAVPAIISRDLFANVQTMIKKHQLNPDKKGNNVKSERYVLTTKLICGECGGNMVGMSGTAKNGTKHYYYSCYQKRHKLAECKNAAVRRELIEESIVAYTLKLLKDEKLFAHIVNEAYAAYTKSQNNGEVELLEKQAKKLQTMIDNATAAIMNGLNSKAIITKLQDAELNLEEVTAKLDLAKLHSQHFTLTRQHIAFFLMNALHMEIDQAKHYIIDIMLNKAIVKKQKDGTYAVTVLYNYANSEAFPNKRDFTITECVRNMFDMVVQTQHFANSLKFYKYYFSATFVIPAA